jgi:hypothetical protein
MHQREANYEAASSTALTAVKIKTFFRETRYGASPLSLRLSKITESIPAPCAAAAQPHRVWQYG